MQFIHELSLLGSTYMYGLLCSTSRYLWLDQSNNNAKHMFQLLSALGFLKMRLAEEFSVLDFHLLLRKTY
jgi:hypothetical protein